MTSQIFLTVIVLAVHAFTTLAYHHGADAPGVSLPISRRIVKPGTQNILQADQARAKALKEYTSRRPYKQDTSPIARFLGEPVANTGIIYSMTIGFGNPPKNFSLYVDTGSANTWIGANENNPFVFGDDTMDTENTVFVLYNSGLFLGEQVVDQLVLPDGTVVHNQSFAVAEFSIGFEGSDGLLGLGPTNLTRGWLYPDYKDSVPTVTDNLLAQGLINSSLVGISFQPTQIAGEANGEITFGSVNLEKFVGDLHFVDLTTTEPANDFVGINQSITYGSSRLPILNLSAGVMDTGTSLTLIATDAFEVYRAVTGALLDPDTNLYYITPEQYSKLESLYFSIGGEEFEFTPNAQIWPQSLNWVIPGNENLTYLSIGDNGSPSGEGLDFVCGMTFAERFYTVYDSGNSQFGIARTPYTYATSN